MVIALDPKNPQTAARMIPPLGRWKRFDDARAAMMKAQLARILAQPGLSRDTRSEEHTSELRSLMPTSYAVFCLQKKKNRRTHISNPTTHPTKASPHLHETKRQ